MSARIFVHPRCALDQDGGALAAHLEGHGYDMIQQIAVFYEAPRKRYELVRRCGVFDATQYFERMDGSRFTHRMGVSHDSAPESA